MSNSVITFEQIVQSYWKFVKAQSNLNLILCYFDACILNFYVL